MFGTFFLSMLWIYYPFTFWPSQFLLRKVLIVYERLTCVWQITFLLLLSQFTLCLLIIFGVSRCWRLWIHLFGELLGSLDLFICPFPSIHLGSFQSLFLWLVFLVFPFSRSSLSGILIMCILYCLMASHKSFSPSSLFCNFFLLLL